jgi:hypothetical protein
MKGSLKSLEVNGGISLKEANSRAAKEVENCWDSSNGGGVARPDVGGGPNCLLPPPLESDLELDVSG